MARATGGAAAIAGLLMIAAVGSANAQAGAAPDARSERAVASVDPFIGTGGEGHTFPGAVVPYGMVQLSPDTRIQPRNKAYGWAAGYRHYD
jgi:putative alpha-1,2-mannosidase